jgi:quercetin dioxygenase-like cupin family protein
MKLHNWNEIENEQITELLTRRYISGNSITIARFILKRGCMVQAHSHENEQMSTVITGTLKFVIDSAETIVSAGETIQIPPFANHAVEALEDTDALDVFSPSRSDWERGDDAYLRSS